MKVSVDQVRTLAALGVVILTADVGEAQIRATLLPQEDMRVATVDGELITFRELDEFSLKRDPWITMRLRQQLAELQERMLDELIGERLLAREAGLHGQSIEKHLETALSGKAKPVTDADVLNLFTQSAARSGLSLDAARPMIKAYLEHQRRDEARQRYIDELRVRAGTRVSVVFDVPREIVPVTPQDPRKGSMEARVEIVEFSDFECPYCQQLQPILRQLLAQFDGQVRIVWKDAPMPIHQFAEAAAEAARCAGEQGDFWRYHDVLFANQQALTPAALRAHAGTLGLDLSGFR